MEIKVLARRGVGIREIAKQAERVASELVVVADKYQELVKSATTLKEQVEGTLEGVSRVDAPYTKGLRQRAIRARSFRCRPFLCSVSTGIAWTVSEKDLREQGGNCSVSAHKHLKIPEVEAEAFQFAAHAGERLDVRVRLIHSHGNAELMHENLVRLSKGTHHESL